MFRYLKGFVTEKGDSFIVIDINGVGYKALTTLSTIAKTNIDEEYKIYCHLHVREDILDIFGFIEEQELEIFKKLIGISGVGPRSALSILNVASVKELIAAINSGKSDLLTKVSGIGRKTAERVVLELKDKLEDKTDNETLNRLESDVDVEEALESLGYNKRQAKEATQNLPQELEGFENRLKEALKHISGETKNS